jgi:hypothetical protein
MISTVSTALFVFLLKPIAYSQTYYDENASYDDARNISAYYLGLGIGLNEIGLLGIAGEIPIANRFSAMGTLGVGGWGVKFRLGANFYPNELSGKNSFGIMYARASGLTGFELTNDNTNNTYTLNLLPAHNIDFVYNRNLFVGKKSKFVLTAGYTLSLNKMAYEEVNGQSIDITTQQILDLLQPGGLLLGIKFFFGN